MNAMPSGAELLELATATALEAGRLVVSRVAEAEVAATKSSPTDVVTEVDLASERLIRERILGTRPDDGFVGEEGDDLPTTSGVVWVADPIDGTVNFLYGIPQYAVSIAAQQDGEVVAGVVHHPVTGETFTAVRGGGARLDGQPIHVSRCTDLRQALVGTGFHYRVEVRTAQVAEVAALMPQVRDIRRMGSAALDLCFVACGRYDAYVERGLKPWDLLAAQLVVEEAGGTVAGLNGAPAGELITTAAGSALYNDFHDGLLSSGFADWPLADWPG
jgi:myo-inositol-1(or 4)-monophosphatase